MRRRSFVLGLLAVVVIIATAAYCIGRGWKQYPALGRVSRIEVRTNEDQLLKTVEDVSTISAFVAYVDNHRTGWGGFNDAFGVPVPSIVANIYDGNVFKGHVGLGNGFLEAQRDESFASKAVSNAEEQEFLQILGVPPSAVRR